jgi:hypothetical protein
MLSACISEPNARDVWIEHRSMSTIHELRPLSASPSPSPHDGSPGNRRESLHAR